MPRPRSNPADLASRKPVWQWYRIGLQFTGRFAASLPKDPQEIRAMLTHRMPEEAPPQAFAAFQQQQANRVSQIDALVAQVVEEVGVGEDGDTEPEFATATFKHNGLGIFYEPRTIRGHFKDCAQQLGPFFNPVLAAFKAKVANHIYVGDLDGDTRDNAPIYLWRQNERITKVDGTETRYIQAMTRQGPRSTVKFIEYVEAPMIEFTLKALNDGVIRMDHIQTLLEYGGTHGMGQERSQQWGQYEVTMFKLLSAPPPGKPGALAYLAAGLDTP